PAPPLIPTLFPYTTLFRSSPETAFSRVVREPLETLFRDGFDQQVVILLDALDEALLSGEKQNIISLLARVNYMPAGVRFIITTRDRKSTRLNSSHDQISYA